METEVYIERSLEKEILKYIGVKEIIAVVGTRQCGKTTMANHILDNLEKKKLRIKRISFDNIKDLKIFEDDIDLFIENYVRGYDILFIDEVHYSKDSGKKLKYIYDNFKIKIIISGSSAAEISIQSLKYLVGRIFTFHLYPFSFEEFLKAKDGGLCIVYKKGHYTPSTIKLLNEQLDDFLIFGGYPRVVLARNQEEKKKVLENIFSTYLLKEIREIFDLSDDDKLIKLLKSLSLQIGNMVNYNELSSLTGFSYPELKKYLNILTKTYICSLIKPFYTNKRTELVKSPKVYFIDTGFRNICIDNFNFERQDKGNLYENLILAELIKKELIPKYWNTKSGAEVDFIIEKSNKVIPVEIKSHLKDSRLTKSFASFLEKYNPKIGYMLSKDYEDRRRVKNTIINFMPFVRFIEKPLR